MLGARNDCDQDGVPDVVEFVFGHPDEVDPVMGYDIQVALCFAASARTRLPLPEGVDLRCNPGGSAMLGSPAMSEEWRLILDDTRYRGTGLTLSAATAGDAPGPNAGGFLPASYWLADPDLGRLVNLRLLPRIELDAPARVPVYHVHEYVDGGNVLDPRLLAGPEENRRLTPRGESYMGPGTSDTIYYAITGNSGDPERARSALQRAGLRLFGPTTAVDELDYRVELRRDGAGTVPLTGEPLTLQSGTIGTTRTLVADVPLQTSPGLSFGSGPQRLRVLLRARSGDLTLERSLDADVQGILHPEDDPRARLLAITLEGAVLAPSASNPFPLGYPLRFDLRLSDSFYANANTPGHAPVAHFSRPRSPDDSATLFMLNLFGLRSAVMFLRSWVPVHVLNYATGQIQLIHTLLANANDFSGLDPDDPPLGDIYRSEDVSTEQLCTALGGCDFGADPFHLFELRVTVEARATFASRIALLEQETELPPGNYQHTHNRAGSGTVTEMVTITAANRPRVVTERRVGRADVDALPPLARFSQMVQLGGPVPNSDTDADPFTDADHDGLFDTDTHPVDATRLGFGLGPTFPLHFGSIRTPLRFARVHGGGYGRASHQDSFQSAPSVQLVLARRGADVGNFRLNSQRPQYPTQGSDDATDFALDFFVSCDARLARDGDSGFDGAPVSTVIAQTMPVETDCLGLLTPVLIRFPAGSVTPGVLPAQVVGLSTTPSSRGFNEDLTNLCGFIPGGVELNPGVQARRTANGCPALVVTNGRSADSGDSFAFAGLNMEGVCPDVRDDSQWPRINQPALGGERCLRLLISDNGPNDAARFENVIADPLVWSGDADFVIPDPVDPGSSSGGGGGGGGGGGIVDPWLLLALLVLAGLHGRRMRAPAGSRPPAVVDKGPAFC